jgi:hypothetical protein
MDLFQNSFRARSAVRLRASDVDALVGPPREFAGIRRRVRSSSDDLEGGLAATIASASTTAPRRRVKRLGN